MRRFALEILRCWIHFWMKLFPIAVFDYPLHSHLLNDIHEPIALNLSWSRQFFSKFQLIVLSYLIQSTSLNIKPGLIFSAGRASISVIKSATQSIIQAKMQRTPYRDDIFVIVVNDWLMRLDKILSFQREATICLKTSVFWNLTVSKFEIGSRIQTKKNFFSFECFCYPDLHASQQPHSIRS